MKLKNILIAVKDVGKAKAFYKDLFGLDVVTEQEGNAVLTEGLVLQDAGIWESVLGDRVIPENRAAELYFEEPDLEGFAERLDRYGEKIRYSVRLKALPWGQKLIRFYDPDGHLIEVRTPARPDRQAAGESLPG